MILHGTVTGFINIKRYEFSPLTIYSVLVKHRHDDDDADDDDDDDDDDADDDDDVGDDDDEDDDDENVYDKVVIKIWIKTL